MSLEAEQAIARIELLCAFWDRISKGETSTTRQIRAAIKGNTSGDHECDQERLIVIMDEDGFADHELCTVCGREF